MTFRHPTRSFTSRDYQFIALAVIVFLALCIGLFRANLTLEGGGDFYVHWIASRDFLFETIDPYSGEVPAQVQRLVYEDSAKAGDEPYILDTPFQLLPIYYPFALLPNPITARAIFTLILELALFALSVLSLRLTDWESPRIFAVLFIFLAVFNFYTFQAIQEASPVLLLGFLYAAILLSLRANLDELAGALIAISLYYWEVGAPFLILVFLRVYHEKRSRVFAGFFMLCFILFFISFLTYPNWIIPFFRAVTNNLRAGFGFNLHDTFIHLWPNQGRALAWIFISVLLLILGFEWSSARAGGDRRFYWACCLSLTVAPLLGFRTEMEHLVVLVIPLAFIFSIVHDRWQKIGSALTVLLMLAVFAVPWALRLSTADHGNTLFIFLPLSTLIGLYWIRWWAIRPPRILIDISRRH